jgi:hypothetical protein
MPILPARRPSINTLPFANENPPLVVDLPVSFFAEGPYANQRRSQIHASVSTLPGRTEVSGVDLMDESPTTFVKMWQGGRGDTRAISRLQQCSRCRTVWYCSKRCQGIRLGSQRAKSQGVLKPSLAMIVKDLLLWEIIAAVAVRGLDSKELSWRHRLRVWLHYITCELLKWRSHFLNKVLLPATLLPDPLHLFLCQDTTIDLSIQCPPDCFPRSPKHRSSSSELNVRKVSALTATPEDHCIYSRNVSLVGQQSSLFEVVQLRNRYRT